MIMTLSKPEDLNSGQMERQITVQGKEYQFYKLPTPERMDEMGALRIRAWKNEPGISQTFFSNATWLDNEDTIAHHWVITCHDEIIAAARLSIHSHYRSIPHADLFDMAKVPEYNNPPFAAFNRLVVSPEHRSKGFSHILDEARIDFAIASGVKTIIAQPVESRIRALERLGFQYIGKVRPLFQMPERQIYFMIKEVK